MAKFGITLSHLHLQYLQIPLDLAIEEALRCNFTHIRLGAYWNRLQQDQETYNFSQLKEILQKFEKNHQSVILTVGVKAPRWPEYYWPDFISPKDPNHEVTKQQILQFVRHTVNELKNFSCITHWQVENEPLDPSGPDNLTISTDLLSQEIELIKELDPRPVIVTLWGNGMLTRKTFDQAANLADIVGLDLYYKQFVKQIFGQNIYKGPNQTSKELQKLILNSSKPVWITELQAEPWEKDEQSYLSKSPQSISPAKLQKNIANALASGAAETLFWGFEYWLWRKQQGDDSYMQIAQSIVK